MRLLVTGGGTGGHIYPALAIAHAVRAARPETEVLYVGTREGLEAEIVPREGLPFANVTARGFLGKSAAAKVSSVFAAVSGLTQALAIVRRFRPDVVVGTGGYVTGPTVLAARLCGVPAAIQEQNAVPGLTNRLLARIVQRVFLPFPEARHHFRHHRGARVTGNPVREAIARADRDEARAALGLGPDTVALFVFGGSRGAQNIHTALQAALPTLLAARDVVIFYVTGQAYYNAVAAALQQTNMWPRENLRLYPYAHNMPVLLAAADVAVVRAGAMTIAELAVRGLPAVIVPSPHVVGNHQEWNARILTDRGAAVYVRDRDLSAETLLRALQPLLRDPELRRQMGAKARAVARPDALDVIARDVIALAERRLRGRR